MPKDAQELKTAQTNSMFYIYLKGFHEHASAIEQLETNKIFRVSSSRVKAPELRQE